MNIHRTITRGFVQWQDITIEYIKQNHDYRSLKKILPFSIFIRVHGHHRDQEEVKDSFMHYWNQLRCMNCLPITTSLATRK